ncbi:MAG: GNAT family N-acetyltransferase [Angustibacter sp.]
MPAAVHSADLIEVTAATHADLAEAGRTMRGVLDADLGGYRPRWHGDLDDLGAMYLDRPGHQLFVARGTDGVLGTAAVRPCVLAAPPNPLWLAEEFNRPDTCQIVRVWVSGAARRRGVGRALVEETVAWAVGPGGYRRVYLHTDAGVPGAEAFWRSLSGRVVHDCRPDPFNCVHFEIDVQHLLRRGC